MINKAIYILQILFDKEFRQYRLIQDRLIIVHADDEFSTFMSIFCHAQLLQSQSFTIIYFYHLRSFKRNKLLPMASIRIQRGLFNQNRTGLWRIPILRLSIIHSRLLIDDHSIISLIARKEKKIMQILLLLRCRGF